jgi:hypothetical protein
VPWAVELAKRYICVPHWRPIARSMHAIGVNKFKLEKAHKDRHVIEYISFNDFTSLSNSSQQNN